MNGTIEFQMLILVHDHSERFLELCEQINEEEGKMPLLRQLLEQRRIELAAFQEERDKVSTFIRMCSLIKQVNLGKLPGKTAIDASRMSIKDLVQSTIIGGKVLPVVTFFGLSPEAKEMISSLSQLSDSILLRQFWKDNGEKALKITAQREEQKMSLGVEDVVQLIWTPSNVQLQSLQDRFLRGVISFGEVDKLFKVFKGNQKYEDLAKEIKLITSRRGSQVKAPDALINKRIEEIQQYNTLHSCIDAARIILDFKTTLGLQGNFQLVEDLHNQMNSEFKQQPLKTMNALREAGRLLSRISPDRASCLDAVTKCQAFITWLKGTITGPQELKVLVDLAIISAGETAMETARITCLHTSCLGFAPLIFDLKPSFGFDELMITCEPVWSAVDADPTLPTKLMVYQPVKSAAHPFKVAATDIDPVHSEVLCFPWELGVLWHMTKSKPGWPNIAEGHIVALANRSLARQLSDDAWETITRNSSLQPVMCEMFQSLRRAKFASALGFIHEENVCLYSRQCHLPRDKVCQ
ncbi:hypothetical protein OS493_005986 [Desmophyllum pertusum]|uniref:Uncharacterized protein n=1 Tax=Desmophyllum pertusum TaxID=174260 RepID=A0A9W9YFM8_9CNID|nr:hypothetical protein OS493_005986 [Desmophyllum pertusum]